MLTGILAGLGAGAFWGMTFVAPLMAPGFSSVDMTVGRFVACGLFALLLFAGRPLAGLFTGMLRRRAAGQSVRLGVWQWPSLHQALAALGLSVLGYTGYYLLLVLAIQDAGAALPVLIIGTIPLWIMLLGKPQALRWRALLPGLLLTALGMVLMMQATVEAADHGNSAHAGVVWRGVLYGVGAMASWTAFGLLNAAWLRRHPEVNSTDWANWLGIAAGVGALFIWGLWGSDWASLQAREGFASFVLICTVTGIGSAWVAAVLWNMASRRLSPSLAGQLIVSETVFGLIYTFAWSAQWPAAIQWAACVLFVLGILASIKAHR
ncbi:MAG: DMT family transporter [Hydrogenophaga sp.]|uniref:DMT family transporter n=1 Tax=Hydrogenophaga sp. TaxID=1904254 RepID=UPI00277AEC96|nr:DMT family transporter [Hydrogenophaga sp.]MDP2419463.1 DMT family transporter [Hydrogenophaga sp.]MDZ4188775.1 DMT family transporter [Hydrogenophaga sp.]